MATQGKKSTQAALPVAYLGPAGTFTEEAVHRFWDAGSFDVLFAATAMDSAPHPSIDPQPVATPQQAVDAVRSGEAVAAVIAIESSVDGPVTPALDALAAGGVRIVAETELEITFALMVRPGTCLSEIRTISTHPVAHQQIVGWLDEHLPGVEFVPASSNGAAAQAVAEKKVDAAAAPARAATLWGLETLADGVADHKDARTRFVLVTPPVVPPRRTGNDRTAIVFQLPNQPGTLVGALNEFALRGVDMSRIGSRPTKRERFTYDFHVDLKGHLADPPVEEALHSLHQRAESLMFLGSWPINEPIGGPIDGLIDDDGSGHTTSPGQVAREDTDNPAARRATAWLEELHHPRPDGAAGEGHGDAANSKTKD